MKTYITLLLLLTAHIASSAPFAQPIPTRWLEGARGFEKALEIQKTNNLPILVWATWSDCPNCAKVTAYLNKPKPAKALRDYIRVIIDEHGNSADAALAKLHHFTGGTFFIIPTSSLTPSDRLWAWEKGGTTTINPDLENILVSKLAAAK